MLRKSILGSNYTCTAVFFETTFAVS